MQKTGSYSGRDEKQEAYGPICSKPQDREDKRKSGGFPRGMKLEVDTLRPESLRISKDGECLIYQELLLWCGAKLYGR